MSMDDHREILTAGMEVEVGPFAPSLEGGIGPWMQVLDSLSDFGNDDLGFKEPPDGTVPGTPAARERKAEEALRDTSILPADVWPLLGLLYEFNVLSQSQIELATGHSKPTVSRRMSRMFSAGIVRGITIGQHKLWTLSDVGARAGRAIVDELNRPLIPFQPGGGPHGENEEARTWGEHFVGTARKLDHDLHVASWALAFAEQVDGDLRYVMNPNSGSVASITGEFGLFYRAPTRNKIRDNSALKIVELPELLGDWAFRGIDSSRLDDRVGNVHPDASICFHDPNRPDGRLMEVWIEMDRQGNLGSLQPKLRNVDLFLGAWNQTVPHFAKNGPPLVVFVAADMAMLRRQMGLADWELNLRGGRRRDGAENFPPPISRQRVAFALESDLHKGSFRAYRLQAWPPVIRWHLASEEMRTEALHCRPQLVSFAPRITPE